MNPSEQSQPGFAGGLAVVVTFAALARGAHDLWSATLVHAAMALGLASVLIVIYRRPAGPGLRLPLLPAAAALLAAAALSAAFAANRSDALFALKDLAAALLAFYAGANAFATDDDTDLLLTMMVPVLWVQAATMIIQLVSTGAFHGLVEARGTLVNPNIQAAFAIFWVPPLVFRVLAARARNHRLLYFASGLAASLAAIVLAGSTWAMVCLGVALLGVFALRQNRPARMWSLVVAAAAIVALVAWYKFTRSQAWTVTGVPPPAGSDRLRWWSAALQMFFAHPWLGVGLGGFPTAYPAFRAGPGQSTLFTHSLPLMVLAETGFLGAVAALAFIIGWKRRVLLALTERGPYVAGAMLFILSSLVNVGPEYLVNQLVLGLFLGISVATLPMPGVRPRLSVVILASGLAILALPMLAAPFMASRLVVDGKSLLAARDAATARQRFDSAVQLDSTSWEAYHGRSLALWGRDGATPKERQAALADMDRAIELNRLNGQLWWESAQMLREAGKMDAARVAISRAQALRPDDDRIKQELGRF